MVGKITKRPLLLHFHFGRVSLKAGWTLWWRSTPYGVTIIVRATMTVVTAVNRAGAMRLREMQELRRVVLRSFN